MKKNLIALVIVSAATLGGISGQMLKSHQTVAHLEYQMNATKTKNSMNELERSAPGH